jgi:hypothetical protein
MITIVSGFGRCGSSLVMQMLAAAGMSLTGPWPSYEDPIANMNGPLMRGDKAAAESLDGKVVKVLDPHVGRLPKWSYRAIWCKRTYKEQARSQVKLLNMLMGVPAGRDDVRAFERSYPRDEPKAMAALRAAGAQEIMVVNFEDLVIHPSSEVSAIANFCGLPISARDAMVQAVHVRDPHCAPDMSMELGLMERRHTHPYI